MMSELFRRGETLALKGQQAKVRAVAQRLRARFGGAAVDVEDDRILVSGSGILKCWLVDPGLRFLGGAAT
jgi:hypothetical protein